VKGSASLAFTDISEDLSARILSAMSSSNVAQFIDQLHLAHQAMVVQAARPSLATSNLSAGAGSGSVGIQGIPFGRASTSSGEPASDAAEAVTRGPDPHMARVRAGGNTQDANDNLTLPRPTATLDLEATGAAAADQAQAVIGGAVTEAGGPGVAKSESDDDSAPADSRKRERDANDDRKPPAKRS
jgi:hypothetical protein